MNVGKKARVIGQRLIHFLTLAFTAFWLVATSRPREPVDDCFVALPQPRLTVALGATAPVSAAPSCAGFDGLTPGATLDIALRRSKERPEKPRGGDLGCWSYEVTELRGVRNVTAIFPEEGSTALFELDATFQGPGVPTGCQGRYELKLAPTSPVRPGDKLDPLRPRSQDT